MLYLELIAVTLDQIRELARQQTIREVVSHCEAARRLDAMVAEHERHQANNAAQ